MIHHKNKTMDLRMPTSLKKCKIILILFLLAGSFVNAQKESQPRFLSVHTGIVTPFSAFSKNSLKNEAGFAENGMNINLVYARLIRKHLGIQYSLAYSGFGFDDAGCVDAYNEALNQSRGAEVAWHTNYQAYKGSIGLLAQSPEILNTNLFVQAELGSALVLLPEIAVNNQNWVIARIRQDDSGYITYGLGAGIKHLLGKKWGVILNYKVMRATPYFRMYNGHSSPRISISSYYYSPYIIRMSWHSFNIGLLYKL